MTQTIDKPTGTIKDNVQTNNPLASFPSVLVDDPNYLVDDPRASSGGKSVITPGMRTDTDIPTPTPRIKIRR